MSSSTLQDSVITSSRVQGDPFAQGSRSGDSSLNSPLSQLTFETWDHGCVIVNQSFAALLRRHGLTTFDAVMQYKGGVIAKQTIAERPTTRLLLQDEDHSVHVYLKRHAPARLKEYIKPFVRLRLPRLGARPEWQAIQDFLRLGIGTMTPIAVGCRGRQSFLLTREIEGCQKLTEWMKDRPRPVNAAEVRDARDILRNVARVLKTIHRSGLSHQDFYAGHILISTDKPTHIQILDLGRVCPLGWLPVVFQVKDLAQLNYSASWFTRLDRFRFLREYLGRRLNSKDLPLIRSIEAKSRRIARHTLKHGL